MPSIADYPPIEGFDDELLTLSKLILRKHVTDRRQLMYEVAVHYGKRSGLRVVPPEEDPAAAQAVAALAELARLSASIVNGGVSADEGGVRASIMSQQAPPVWEKHAVPPAVVAALRAGHSALCGGAQPPQLFPDAGLSRQALEHLYQLRDLPPDSFFGQPDGLV
ncbi:hypothetical protein DIPPA_01089 [Diplonema papillatum]|nr:hypothetical protein DIPPA_01089 [Diplonema papillatum]